MRLKIKLRDVPGRMTTGVYVFHTGLEKWSADEERAAGVHGMAKGAYPFLDGIPASQFIKLLAAGEMATGAALLNPFVSNQLAGLALTGFSGALLGMYWRTESLHQPGSPWPTQAGIAVSKDVWMLGIGLGLLLSGGRSNKKGAKHAR